MRWLKITAEIVGAIVVIAGLFALGLYWLYSTYKYTQPTADYPKPASKAEAQRDDLDYLRHLPQDDWSYTDKTRAEAEGLIDAALKQKLPMKLGPFELLVARVNALANNGHTNVWGGARANRLVRLPIRVYSFADGVFIVRALPAYKALLGAQILAIDGHSIGDVAKTMSAYTGGTAEEKNARLPFYIEAPQLLRAAGMANTNDSLALTMKMPDGTTETRLVLGDDPDPKAPKLWPSDELKPVANEGESKDWIPALKGKVEHLLMFRGEPKPFFDASIPGTHGYYIRFDTNDDSGNLKIADFAEAAFRRAVATKPDVVVVDLRMNGGGDYTTTAHFMRNLPLALPTAKFYILLSQETFSAGMTSAAFLKQAAGDRGFFVGTRPGDRIRFNAEGGDFCLPFSGICMGVRTAIHDYSTTQCRPLFTCYIVNWFYPVAIKSFEADIKAPLTWGDLNAGRDPALEAIFPTRPDLPIQAR